MLFRSVSQSRYDVAAEFAKMESGIRKLSSIRPDLGNFADDFIKQTDIIENEMGRLTRYGKGRSETDKALGFDITEADIASELEINNKELSEYKNLANLHGKESVSRIVTTGEPFTASYKEQALQINFSHCLKPGEFNKLHTNNLHYPCTLSRRNSIKFPKLTVVSCNTNFAKLS